MPSAQLWGQLTLEITNSTTIYIIGPQIEKILKKIRNNAQMTEDNLSDEDKTLIKNTEKDPEAAGFSQESKNDGVFDVLKNIATIRMYIRQLKHSQEEESQEEEKKKDIQKLIKVYRMIEDYREPELKTLQNETDELQKTTRTKIYAETIGAKKMKDNVKNSEEMWALSHSTRKKADEITKKLNN